MSTTTTVASAVSTTSSTSSATATCVNMKPGENGYLPPEACGSLLDYYPSYAAAMAFVVLFGIASLLHFFLMFYLKKRYAWVVTMGALWETAAFVFKVLLTKNQNNVNYMTGFTLLFLLAPLWINAFLYMTLGRMVNFFDPDQYLAGISARRYGLIFVGLDIISFIVQAVGAVITSQTGVSESTTMLGVHIYMGGIGLQEFFILGFVFLLVKMHKRMLFLERNGIAHERLNRGSMPWRWLFYSVYTALLCITIRIIYRLIQYAQGTSSNDYFVAHEWPEYVFDASPMLIALVVLIIFHPGRSICGPGSTFAKLTKAEKKEMKAQRKAAKAWKKDGSSYENLNSQEEGFMAPNEQLPMEVPLASQPQYEPDYPHPYSQPYPDSNEALYARRY